MPMQVAELVANVGLIVAGYHSIAAFKSAAATVTTKNNHWREL